MGNTFMFLLMALNTALSSKEELKTTDQQTNIYHVNVERQRTEVDSLYDEMNLSPVLKYEAFRQAMEGRKEIPAHNKDIMTVIDFSLASTEKRLVVLDLKNKKVLFHTLVSHGKNSGENYAVDFSNQQESLKSSLGFFVTENTYNGENGYSLVLNGLEEGINDNAKARYVVMHGADYCSTGTIASLGRLGKSYGCPAVPREYAGPIINTIKDGTLLFIYADNDEYLAKSRLIHQPNILMAHYQRKQAVHADEG
ncbi:murein L,D-transpeptidase catalytic domain family protein [Sphingobacterium thalpophilum]|uniref:murein L,D-transpeptidase catalytic domain family protein n=1 Tax=Sphingobacterium thalpophilum TaxID=259 RepID=UPI0024A6B362|nr:murein L,D-transpeptidase catalytic domain family protein [Sphingobacterium thalpophilum]